MKFPALSNGLRCILSSEMEKVVREEKFLKEEPDRLESALRRCKKLTGTLVTLKRLVLETKLQCISYVVISFAHTHIYFRNVNVVSHFLG